jgi:Bacterial extracellular solute-binding protein
MRNQINLRKFKYMHLDSIKVLASLPYPLKVPFKQLFYPFTERYNLQNQSLPIYSPDINECSPFGFDFSLKNAQKEEDLPDVYLSSGLGVLFSNTFYKRFIDTGILIGYMEDTTASVLPESINKSLIRHNIGALAFSSWGVVQDMSATKVTDTPSSWAELLRLKYQNQISLHGCHGKAGSISLLLFLHQHCGKKAVEKFAHNILDIRHFAQIIKRMDTSSPLRTAFNVLPDAAVSHIPSWKHVQRLTLEEGLPLNPLVLMVKRSKVNDCKPVIDFFYSQPFREMLAHHGYLMADNVIWNNKYVLPDFDRLANDGFEQVAESIQKQYIGSLRHDKIEKRILKS